jgi:hypothetical protein
MPEEVAMIARMATLQGSADRLDDGVRNYREQVVPTAQGQAGYKGALLLVDRKAVKAVSITLWECEQAQKASEAAVAQLRQQAAQEIGATQAPSVEIFEVAFQS